MTEMIANRYQVLSELGEGGMGKVYKVKDTLKDRTCALKVLSQKVASDAAFLQFKQEFWFMTKLKHPNIVNVYEYGVLEDASPYLTMELVDGKELAEMGQVSFEVAFDVLIQMAKALGFIHSRLLVHRDIKAENVRITPEGQVKLMDFGLMQALGERSNGQLSGTIAYMPPEIPQRGVVNESSDLYSLGILAFEMLAGVQPFIGNTVLDVIKAHIESEPATIRSFRPKINPALEALILRLIEKDQEDRFESAELLLDALAEASGRKDSLEDSQEKNAYLTSHVLVGRDHEFETLTNALKTLRESKSSQSYFIGAPAGVGKSRLIEEFKIHAQLEEIPFCQGICTEQSMRSFEPMIQALQHLLPLTPPETLVKKAPILSHFFPLLQEQGFEPLPGFDIKVQKITLYETIIEWIQTLAKKQPLVLLIDDLHWSDLGTIELFNYCIRELEQDAVFILGSFRDDEVAANSPLWQTPEEGLTQSLHLKPLTQSDTAELVSKMLRKATFDEEFIPFFYAATAGNAFFIREMLRYLMEENLIQRVRGEWVIPNNYTQWELPTSIGDTINHRLKRLSDPAVELVKKISVAGKKIALPLLNQWGKASVDTLFEHLEELVERQFLQRQPEGFIFPHDRVRETLYASLDDDFKRPIHQEIGEWLEEQNEASAVLAYHFKQGLDKVKAMTYLIQAGQESTVRMESTLLMHEGLTLLEVLDELENKNDLLESYRRQLAWVSYMIHPFICIETNEKLLQGLKDENAPLAAQIEFESLLISSFTMVGKNKEALKKADDLLTQIKPNTLPHALILFGRLNALLTRGEFRQLVKEMETAVEILKPLLPSLKRQMTWAYAFCCFIREDALAWLGESVGQDEFGAIPGDIGKSKDFLDLVFWSHYPEVVRNSLVGNYQAILSQTDDIFNLVKKMGRPIQHENRFQLCLAFAAIENEDIATGERYAEKIVALGEKMNNPHQQASGKILQGMLAAHKLHDIDAIEFFAEAVELGRKSETDQLLPALYRLAAVQIRQEDLLQAEVLIEEAHALATSDTLENPYHQIHTFRTKAHLAQIQNQAHEVILELFNESIAIAQSTKNTLQSAHSHLACAKYLIESENFPLAKTHLETAKMAYHQVRLKRPQVQELIDWIVTQEAPVVPAIDELLPHIQAQELGNRVAQLLKDMNLAQIGGSEGQIENLSDRLEKVERVNQFSQLIMKSLDLQMVLKNIMDYVIDIAQADRGILMLKDEQGKLTAQVMRTAEGEVKDTSRLKKFSQSFTKKVIETGESLWVQDAQSDSEFSQKASIMALDLRTIICVPLKTEREVIGLVYLDRQAISQTFSQADLDLVESMATFATISLMNAKLHAQLQDRSDRLQMLNELSRALSSTIDFKDLLSMVLKFSLDITQGEAGYLFIREDMEQIPATLDDLICQASRDKRGRPLADIQVSQTIVNKVLIEKGPVCIVDMQDDQDMAMQQSVMALELKSVMCVPIFGKSQNILGIVYVSSQAVSYCFTPRDLAMMESIVLQVGLDIENRHLMELRKKQELVDRELSLARNIQSSMLPDYNPDIPTIDIVGFSQSADAVGGDYYDYFKISDFTFGMAIGDVNGHGVSAGLLMAMAKSCLFVQGKIDPSVLAVMTALNSMIFGGTKERLFMTFVYSIFDLEKNTVKLSSAGHHLPYHYKAKEKVLSPIEVRPTYPLGVREKGRFNEVSLALEPKDILVYYTDGIVEAHSVDGEEFGFERFEELVVKHANLSATEMKDTLLKAYEDWIGDQPPEDDMTLVVVKVKSEKTEDIEPKEKKKLKTGLLTLINR